MMFSRKLDKATSYAESTDIPKRSQGGDNGPKANKLQTQYLVCFPINIKQHQRIYYHSDNRCQNVVKNIPVGTIQCSNLLNGLKGNTCGPKM